MGIVLLCSFLIPYRLLKIVILASALMKSQKNYTKQGLMWGRKAWVVIGGGEGRRGGEVVDNGGEGERGGGDKN